MDFLSNELNRYIEQHTTAPSELLNKIERVTHQRVLMPRMISGALQGRVLSMLSKLVRPHNILEIGTYTGYSALCLAEGLDKNGKVITIDLNQELEEMVRGFFRESAYLEQIDYLIGNAMDILPDLEGPFDMVFIDADKENYGQYYDLVIDRVPTGGIIVADNVLWSGKVLENSTDRDTSALKEFNKKVTQDDRVENVLFPIRDGLMICRKC